MSRTITMGAAVALLVASASPAPAQGRTISLTGAPLATLDESFSAINGFQEIAPDKVVIADVNEKKLVLGDLKTNSVRNIGRQGGGPGEWQMALNVLPAPGGTVYVSDPSLRRLHIVDATGKITGSVPFPGAESDGNGRSFIMSLPRATDAQGRIYTTGSPFTPGQQEQPDSVPIVRFDPKSKRTDTLGMIRNDTKVTQSSGGAAGATRVMARVGGGPFAPNTVWQPTRDGRIVMVHPAPYRVDFLEGAGRVRRGTVVPYTPIKVTAADREEVRERQRTQRPVTLRMGGSGGVSTGPGARGAGQAPPIADADFPPTKPPFTGGNAVQVTPEGEVWVLRTRIAGDRTPTYDIFDGTGRLVGKAVLKPNSAVVGFGAGTVYVSRQDPDDDLLYLEKYRRTPGADGADRQLGSR